MDFEADRMRGWCSPMTSWQASAVILEERNQRIDNDPAARLASRCGGAVSQSPYHGR